MKTSNKILIITLAILIISLIAYDLSLRAEYRKGDYTNPYRDYISLNYHDFNEIELNASTAVNIIIVQGPYKVLANPGAEDFLRVNKQGKRLVINAAFPDHYRNIAANYVLYISCSKLSLLKTDARYTTNGAPVTDTVARDIRWYPTLIKGFSLDSLKIQADHASNIVLENNRINILNGVTGQSSGSGSALTIGGNNKFAKSNLDICNKSQLVIKGGTSADLNYHLADSATLVVNGAAVKHLLNLK
ncbi:hypothetical protein [Mucilaginibacter sp. BT774]|uniref:hypothetical protein n=1 Tax=Mucilaginibacter sp. BT774 TaxID=3062276 RepID=UPI0026766E04|nr:hypothetical protein [Mucilaginibacter sp. BT774]MDO3626710.1 hypothetical protein [Mucilaginibacter sp. BT774]